MLTRLAQLIVRAAAAIAAPARRARIIKEWDAELWHETQASGAFTALRHAFGAFPDALASRRIARSTRPARRAGWMSLWPADFALALRGFRRNPGFAAVTVLTLALGLGGSAAIFTIIDRVVLEPLPYPTPERLVDLANQVPGVGPEAVWGMSTAQQIFITERSSTIDAIGIYRGLGANIDTPDGPRRAAGWRVTASLMPLLGARAHLGRVITPADDTPGGPPVVLLSYEFWQRQFGSDAGIVGQVISISDQPFEVIGVTQPGLRTPGTGAGRSTDLWMPLRIDVEGRFSNNHTYGSVARLAEGIDAAAAEAELKRLTLELPEAFPTAYTTGFLEGSGFHTRVMPLKESVVGDMARNLWIVFGAVGLVLLIACGNVANLFLVRMEGRRTELGVRAALGAGRAALWRLLLAEGLVLAAAGGGLGLWLGNLGLPALMGLAPGAIPRLEAVHLGSGTIWFVAMLSLAVGLVLGTYPVLQSGRAGHVGLVAGGNRSATDGRARHRTRSLLIVSQVALALTLVVGAGLLVESLRRIQSIDPGFDPAGVLTAGLYLTPVRYQSDIDIWRAYNDIQQRVRAIPGVTAVGMSEELPVEGGFGCTVQGFEDQAVYDHLRDLGIGTCAGQERTTPGYFAAMGIPVLQGREFTEGDNDNPTTGAVVVSKAFADRFWPGEDPIGRGVAPSGRTVPPFYHVVGVVGDTPAKSLDGEPALAIHYPIRHNPDTPGNWGWWQPGSVSIVVRVASGDPMAIFPQVRRAVAEVDPSIPLTRVLTMDDIFAESTARLTFTSVLLATAALVALLLAAVGLYGVVSYVVSRSTREIGMRIAVGAQPGDIVRLFLKRSTILIATGTVIGTGFALATTRVMTGLLYGIEPTDPRAFVIAAAVLAFIAFAATWIPARRAARVEPVEALRTE